MNLCLINVTFYTVAIFVEAIYSTNISEYIYRNTKVVINNYKIIFKSAHRERKI